MEAISVVLSLLLATICMMSALMDFKKYPRTVETIAHLRCPFPLNVLGAVKTMGAVGLIIGVWANWLGAISAICLAAYFYIATSYHRKAKDSLADTFPAVMLMGFSVATFIFILFAG